MRKFPRDHADEIFRLYQEEKMNCPQIGLALGLNPKGVWAFLKASGIAMRSKSEAKALCVLKSSQSPCWKGGLRPDGYAVRSEIRGGKKVNILQHREKAAEYIGRPLIDVEVVHHCNEIKSDNRPENLWVFACQADHARFHKSGYVDQSVIFTVAQVVISYGQPWNIPWL
jgi:hypothetical protein